MTWPAVTGSDPDCWTSRDQRVNFAGRDADIRRLGVCAASYIASIASAVLSLDDSNSDPYTSIVVLKDECPHSSWISFACAPAAIRTATDVCLTSCQRRSGLPMRSRAFFYLCEVKDERCGVLPRVFTKTSPSFPGWASGGELLLEDGVDRRPDRHGAPARLSLRRVDPLNSEPTSTTCG